MSYKLIIEVNPKFRISCAIIVVCYRKGILKISSILKMKTYFSFFRTAFL